MDISLKAEWYIDSVYSFLTIDALPFIPSDEKIKLVAEYINETENMQKVSEDDVRDMIENDLTGNFPVVSDTDDVSAVMHKWAERNLSENEALYTEYVDDGNSGQIRIMLFEGS